MTDPTPPKPAPAADHPRVPRMPRSVLTKLALGFSALVLGGYAAVAITQHELGNPEREEVPASVRSSPGGYRSYAFWHSGYHGGK